MDSFLEKFKKAAKEFTVGDPMHKDTKMGALVSKDHMEKVLGYVDLAKKEGGTIEFGGDKLNLAAPNNNGYFIEPTIITGLTNDCRVMQEEIFGPVVTVTTFKSEDEAIKMANNVRYGLSASVWTKDISRAHKVANKIQSGTVWINTWMQRDLRVPFGGMKDSGIGREGGEYSVEFYSELKNICINFDN